MEIKTKEELLAALRLAQIHVETCDDVDIDSSFVDRTLSCNGNIRIERESISYTLGFKISNYKPIAHKRVRIRKLRKRL